MRARIAKLRACRHRHNLVTLTTGERIPWSRARPPATILGRLWALPPVPCARMHPDHLARRVLARPLRDGLRTSASPALRSDTVTLRPRVCAPRSRRLFWRMRRADASATALSFRKISRSSWRMVSARASFFGVGLASKCARISARHSVICVASKPSRLSYRPTSSSANPAVSMRAFSLASAVQFL